MRKGRRFRQGEVHAKNEWKELVGLVDAFPIHAPTLTAAAKPEWATHAINGSLLLAHPASCTSVLSVQT